MKVKIYQPAKTAMQSGVGRTRFWVVEPVGTGHRDVEPLMGWVSIDSTAAQLKGRLKFESLDDNVIILKD